MPLSGTGEGVVEGWSVSGGQFVRASPGRQSVLRVSAFGVVLEPDSARRIVPLLLELFWSVSREPSDLCMLEQPVSPIAVAAAMASQC